MLCRKSTLLDLNGWRSDTVIVTSNRRLASKLHERYDALQTNNGLNVWLTPTILPLATWVEHTWREQAHSEHILLSSTQESILWERAIEADDAELLGKSSTAQLAQQAWQLLHHWQLDPATLNQHPSEDLTHFLTWCTHFTAACRSANAITAAELPAKLLQAAQSGNMTLKTISIELVGFDDLPPVFEALFTTLQAQLPVAVKHVSVPESHAHQIALHDEREEIRTMAQWARTQLETHPDARIACIVPNLQAIREQVNTAFTEVFSPESFLPGHASTTLPFNLSAGRALSQYSVIDTALTLLRIDLFTIDLERFTPLVTSPYVATQDCSLSAGAALDLMIRQYNLNHFNISALYKPLTNLLDTYPEHTWLQQWRGLKDYRNTLPKTQRASDWAQCFHKECRDFGWPGTRGLNSEEYQLVERFQKLLEEFSTLDTVLGNLSRARALSVLTRLATQTPFQPEGSNMPIQVLGVLESAGYAFDAVWMMGLSSDVWPAPCKPNPFIPYALQREHGMPRASAPREFHYTHTMMQRIMHSTPECYFSYPTHDRDKACLPSRLLEDIPLTSVEKLTLSTKESFAENIQSSSTLETFEDTKAPTLLENETVRGGSWILKQQALCPFRAFASVRLKAESIPQPQFGIPATERGTLVHACLESLWNTLKTHTALCNYDDASLRELVQTVCSNTVANFKTRSEAPDTLWELEAKRTEGLLLDWLELEKTREPFEVVQCEAERTITLGDLTFSIKIDRIDELYNGQHVVIDYKTGLNSIYHWLDDRPRDPQLLLYGLYGNEDHTYFNGITIGEVRVNGVKFRGMIEHQGESSAEAIPGVKTLGSFSDFTPLQNWAELTEHWRESLNTLAEEFTQGIATVTPLDDRLTCQTCEFQSLCRINE